MELSQSQLARLQGMLVVPPPDAVAARLSELEDCIRELTQAIANIPHPKDPDKPATIDMTPVIQRLDDVEEAIAKIPTPDRQSVDFDPLLTRLSRLEKMLAQIPQQTRKPEYRFDIKRDGDGKIQEVIASPIPTTRTTLKGG